MSYRIAFLAISQCLALRTHLKGSGSYGKTAALLVRIVFCQLLDPDPVRCHGQRSAPSLSDNRYGSFGWMTAFFQTAVWQTNIHALPLQKDAAWIPREPPPAGSSSLLLCFTTDHHILNQSIQDAICIDREPPPAVSSTLILCYTTVTTLSINQYRMNDMHRSRRRRRRRRRPVSSEGCRL